MPYVRRLKVITLVVEYECHAEDHNIDTMKYDQLDDDIARVLDANLDGAWIHSLDVLATPSRRNDD
jgi:hypothetical protein